MLWGFLKILFISAVKPSHDNIWDELFLCYLGVRARVWPGNLWFSWTEYIFKKSLLGILITGSVFCYSCSQN